MIEILSPGTAEKDKILKRKLYAKFGVKEFWLVDGKKKEIEVLSLQEEGFKKIGTYTGEEILVSPRWQDIRIPVNEVFRV